MNDWQPSHYLKFKSERTQPSIDLVGRIDMDAPKDILDAGCGPGNSTQILRQRWPEACITGIDSSRNMIDRAKVGFPDGTWQVADIMTYEPERKFDLVFSNAVIQWIPDHDTLLKRMAGLLKDKGVLAVQVPLFCDMPLGQAINRVSKKDRWDEATADCRNMFTYNTYNGYYDLLSGLFDKIEMWETFYLHEMASLDAIIDWIKSTGMKPYLDAIPEDDGKQAFASEVREIIKADYPVQRNGMVLFPFKRLFFVCSRAG